MAGGGAPGPMEGGGVGTAAVGATVVGDLFGPVYTTAGHDNVGAGTGQKSPNACRFLALPPCVMVKAWNLQSERVMGARVMVLVQVPALTVIKE